MDKKLPTRLVTLVGNSSHVMLCGLGSLATHISQHFHLTSKSSPAMINIKAQARGEALRPKALMVLMNMGYMI